MLDYYSKLPQRTKFKLKMGLYIFFIGVFLLYLIFASYFVDAAYHDPILKGILQLTQNLTKAPPGSYATEVLVSYGPQFISITAVLALGLVWINAIARAIQIGQQFAKFLKENAQVQTDDR